MFVIFSYQYHFDGFTNSKHGTTRMYIHLSQTYQLYDQFVYFLYKYRLSNDRNVAKFTTAIKLANTEEISFWILYQRFPTKNIQKNFKFGSKLYWIEYRVPNSEQLRTISQNLGEIRKFNKKLKLMQPIQLKWFKIISCGVAYNELQQSISRTLDIE